MILTPFYDIINITVYDNKYETDFAMGINEAFNYDELGTYDFVEFCEELNINVKGFVKEFKRVSNQINKSLDNPTLVELSNENKIEFFKKYKNDVQERIKKLTPMIDYCVEYISNSN